jgi:hypothetical protein
MNRVAAANPVYTLHKNTDSSLKKMARSGKENSIRLAAFSRVLWDNRARAPGPGQYCPTDLSQIA